MSWFSDAADWFSEKVDRVADVVKEVIKNPLPVIETIALTLMGVPPPVASAVVTAMNGGNIEDIAKSAAIAYVGGKVANSASGATTSALQPSQGAYLPTAVESTMIKVASSAVGADAAATVAALASGKSLEDSLKAGTKAATINIISSAGAIAGQQVSGQIEDPTLSKVAGAATRAGTAAALSGKDAGKAALTAGGQIAGGELLDRAGNVIGDVASNVDLSSVKDTFKPVGEAIGKITQPISDVATKTLQPISDVATTVLQPLEAPIRGVVQKGSDIATSIAEPVGKGISKIADASGKALSSLGGNLSGDALDKSIIDLMAKAPGDTVSETTSGTTVAGGPSVSDVAGGAAASPAAFGGADVAMLGDTSEAGLGSKVSKKGGKYPWGEPEGTTALKEGLGIG